ncbi:MAG: hypothetical protein ACFFAY_15665 [Promethearchaeota archaeon]
MSETLAIVNYSMWIWFAVCLVVREAICRNCDRQGKFERSYVMFAFWTVSSLIWIPSFANYYVDPFLGVLAGLTWFFIFAVVWITDLICKRRNLDED